MNTKVTVTGMTVTTQVSSNLMIAKGALADAAKKDESAFATSDTDELTGKLEPVSTTTGKAFFYTVNAKANGDANEDVYAAYNAVEVPTSDETSAFGTAYGATGAVGYIDYVFQLKAVNTDTANGANIVISKLNLTYAGAKDPSKAYRVAVFCQDMGEAGGTCTAGSGDLVGVYSEASATNQIANKVVDSTTSVDGTLACNAATKVATVPAGKTNYYKVVIRLYLEGEDTTCTTATFLDLTQSWALDLELTLGNSSAAGVKAITKYTSYTYAATSKDYVCDGTNVYLKSDLTTALTSATIADATTETALETAFGVTIS